MGTSRGPAQKVRLDIARVMDPAAWEGVASVGTRDHVRAAMGALARKHDLEVDEVVSMVWLLAQDPSVRDGDDQLGVLVTAVVRSVTAARESERRMVAHDSGRRPCASDEATAARLHLGEIELLIANATERGDVTAIGDLLAARDDARASERLASTPVRLADVSDALLAPGPSSAGAGISEALSVVVDALNMAGWSRARAERVVEAVAACAQGQREVLTGSATAAKRLGDDEVFAGQVGLGLSRWRAVVELVVGSRSRPGVPSRVVLGEPAEQVLRDPAVIALAQRANGQPLRKVA